MQSLIRQYLECIKSFSRNEPKKIEFNLFEKRDGTDEEG